MHQLATSPSWKLLGTGIFIAAVVFACCNSSLSAADRASAPEIANEMLANNASLKNIEGTVTRVVRTYVGAEGIGGIEQEMATLSKGASSDNMRAAIEKTKQRMLSEVRDDGFTKAVDTYQGLIDASARFSVTRTSLRSDDMKVEPVLYVSDNNIGMCYDPNIDEAIVGQATDQGNIVAQEASTLFPVFQWITRPNQIASADAVSIVEWTSYQGKPAVAIHQGPTDYSLNRSTIRYIVVPSLGYCAVRTEFKDVTTGNIIRVVDGKNVSEIAPGIWRPLEWVDTRYKLCAAGITPAVDYQIIVRIDRLVKVNQQLTASAFSTAVPVAATRVVNLLDNKKHLQVDLEEPIGAGGVREIEKQLASPQTSPPDPKLTGVQFARQTDHSAIKMPGAEEHRSVTAVVAAALGVPLLLLLGVLAIRRARRKGSQAGQ